MASVVVGTDDGIREIPLVARATPRADGTLEDVALAGRHVAALAADGDAMWAITDGDSLYRLDPGADWERVADVHRAGRCLLASRHGLFVGTAEGRLFTLDGDLLRAVHTFDEIPTRDKWHTPWGGPPDTRSMAEAPDGTLYVNVHVGGILRSRDGGHSWQQTGLDIDADVHQVIVAGDTLLAAAAVGIVTSGDGGDSWEEHTDGLHGTYCRAVAVAGGTLYASASESFRGKLAAIYRAPLTRETAFERSWDGLPDWFAGNIDTHCVAASGKTAVFGTEDGRVMLSRDSGVTWSALAVNLPAVRCLLLRA